MDELTHAKRVLETVLLASHEPLPLDEIVRVFDPPVPTETVRLLLADLTAEWKEREEARRARQVVPRPGKTYLAAGNAKRSAKQVAMFHAETVHA